ncbi:hypothetical protein [Stieleria mannarensis]|uniref:GAP1-N2 domain-containing protein n=1 Tax=Stieleria mannarensis TaxID=2755585 RepID=UPI001C7226AB|nr:hypothetical protein [Rhodopirellula sp. JC639]
MSNSSELVYTSAPRGLRPGSRGFCTVAMSESMPAGLIGPLESLSAYHPADTQGPSPINYMHVQIKVAGRPVNVLSRIAESPPDYTGRTNKIAHHVIVAAADRAVGGPAAVLRQPGFAIETWDGEVRKIPEPKTIPQADSPPRIAQTWAEQSGDAGWAGTVASVFDSQTPGAPLYLIYRPDQNAELLALVDEAICLLPEPKRWNATFSTHTSELPPGVDCRLRCLVAGSPEALALPRSAMKLDLASGNLGTPPPGPLVDAARSGRLALPEIVRPAAVPAASTHGQTEILQPTLQTPVSDAKGPELPVSPPQPILATLPPPFQPKASPTENHAWTLLAIAVVVLLCLGGAAAMFFLQDDSDVLLAELNAAAGIENLPDVDVSTKVLPEPDVELEPEPDMEPESAEDAKINDKGGERKNADETDRQSREELAKKILAAEAFLSDDHENSITKFSNEIEDDLQVLAEQKKQLKELSLQPTEDQLATWVRADDSMEQLTRFIDTRKNDVDTLKKHRTLKDLRDQRERLASELKAWNREAKKWEHEKGKQPELVLLVSNRLKVDQTIKKVRATAERHLQQSMTSLLDRYKERSAENNQLAASIEEKLDSLHEKLAADLKRRRDSHRLAIYFDGNSRRHEDRLQIKPRCEIVLSPNNLQAIDRLSVDDSRPIPLSQSSDDVKLPGRYEGWLAVMRGDSGVILKLNPRTIPPAMRKLHPMLQQLDRFVKQQDKAFESSGSLQATFEANWAKVNSEINQFRRQFLNDEDEQKKVQRWNNAVKQMKQLFTQSPAKELDDLYIEQTGTTAEDLRSIKSNIAEVFTRFVTPDVPIGSKIESHIKNLEMLRDDYRQLKTNTGLLDFEGTLVFGNASGSRLGQSSFETIETYELFFIPELVYGPPPKE